jgi:hypothetical protein
MRDCYWWWDALPAFLNKEETKQKVSRTSLATVKVLIAKLGVKQDLTWMYMGKPALRSFQNADK